MNAFSHQRYRWIEEVPGVNCQERDLEELEESLKSALEEALEFEDNA